MCQVVTEGAPESSRRNLARFQHIPQHSGETFDRERFRQQVYSAVQNTMVYNRVARVARGEDHLQSGSATNRLVRELTAVHARQTNISEQQCDAGIVIDYLESTRPVGRLQNKIAQMSQCFGAVFTDIFIVFDDKHGLDAERESGRLRRATWPAHAIGRDVTW